MKFSNFAPSSCPGLVIWGGSNGPVSNEVIDFYANRGIAVLAIEYFTNDPKLAKPYLTLMINHTPLEIAERAILWIKRQPQVNIKKIALVGTSRGGEFALLAGSKFSQHLSAVIANRPNYTSVSSSVNGNTPIVMETQDETFAWTYRGQGIPYMPISSPQKPKQGINELAEQTGGIKNKLRWNSCHQLSSCV